MWCNTATGGWNNFTRHGQCALQTFKSHPMLCKTKANQDADAEVLFSRAIGAPVEDFAVWTQWSFLEVFYLVSINSLCSLSLSHLKTSYPHLLPVSGGSILTQNLKLLQKTETWRKGWHPLLHVCASVITGAPQKNLFLTSGIGILDWQPGDVISETFIYPADTQCYLHTQPCKHDSLCCSSYLSMTGPEQWRPQAKLVFEKWSLS